MNGDTLRYVRILRRQGPWDKEKHIAKWREFRYQLQRQSHYIYWSTGLTCIAINGVYDFPCSYYKCLTRAQAGILHTVKQEYRHELRKDLPKS